MFGWNIVLVLQAALFSSLVLVSHGQLWSNDQIGPNSDFGFIGNVRSANRFAQNAGIIDYNKSYKPRQTRAIPEEINFMVFADSSPRRHIHGQFLHHRSRRQARDSQHWDFHPSSIARQQLNRQGSTGSSVPTTLSESKTALGSIPDVRGNSVSKHSTDNSVGNLHNTRPADVDLHLPFAHYKALLQMNSLDLVSTPVSKSSGGNDGKTVQQSLTNEPLKNIQNTEKSHYSPNNQIHLDVASSALRGLVDPVIGEAAFSQNHMVSDANMQQKLANPETPSISNFIPPKTGLSHPSESPHGNMNQEEHNEMNLHRSKIMQNRKNRADAFMPEQNKLNVNSPVFDVASFDQNEFKQALSLSEIPRHGDRNNAQQTEEKYQRRHNVRNYNFTNPVSGSLVKPPNQQSGQVSIRTHKANTEYTDSRLRQPAESLHLQQNDINMSKQDLNRLPLISPSKTGRMTDILSFQQQPDSRLLELLSQQNQHVLEKPFAYATKLSIQGDEQRVHSTAKPMTKTNLHVPQTQLVTEVNNSNRRLSDTEVLPIPDQQTRNSHSLMNQQTAEVPVSGQQENQRMLQGPIRMKEKKEQSIKPLDSQAPLYFPHPRPQKPQMLQSTSQEHMANQKASIVLPTDPQKAMNNDMLVDNTKTNFQYPDLTSGFSQGTRPDMLKYYRHLQTESFLPNTNVEPPVPQELHAPLHIAETNNQVSQLQSQNELDQTNTPLVDHVFNKYHQLNAKGSLTGSTDQPPSLSPNQFYTRDIVPNPNTLSVKQETQYDESSNRSFNKRHKNVSQTHLVNEVTDSYRPLSGTDVLPIPDQQTLRDLQSFISEQQAEAPVLLKHRNQRMSQRRTRIKGTKEPNNKLLDTLAPQYLPHPNPQRPQMLQSTSQEHMANQKASVILQTSPHKTSVNDMLVDNTKTNVKYPDLNPGGFLRANRPDMIENNRYLQTESFLPYNSIEPPVPQAPHESLHVADFVEANNQVSQWQTQSQQDQTNTPLVDHVFNKYHQSNVKGSLTGAPDQPPSSSPDQIYTGDVVPNPNMLSVMQQTPSDESSNRSFNKQHQNVSQREQRRKAQSNRQSLYKNKPETNKHNEKLEHNKDNKRQVNQMYPQSSITDKTPSPIPFVKSQEANRKYPLPTLKPTHSQPSNGQLSGIENHPSFPQENFLVSEEKIRLQSETYSLGKTDINRNDRVPKGYNEQPQENHISNRSSAVEQVSSENTWHRPLTMEIRNVESLLKPKASEQTVQGIPLKINSGTFNTVGNHQREIYNSTSNRRNGVVETEIPLSGPQTETTSVASHVQYEMPSSSNLAIGSPLKSVNLWMPSPDVPVGHPIAMEWRKPRPPTTIITTNTDSSIPNNVASQRVKDGEYVMNWFNPRKFQTNSNNQSPRVNNLSEENNVQHLENQHGKAKGHGRRRFKNLKESRKQMKPVGIPSSNIVSQTTVSSTYDSVVFDHPNTKVKQTSTPIKRTRQRMPISVRRKEKAPKRLPVKYKSTTRSPVLTTSSYPQPTAPTTLNKIFYPISTLSTLVPYQSPEISTYPSVNWGFSSTPSIIPSTPNNPQLGILPTADPTVPQQLDALASKNLPRQPEQRGLSWNSNIEHIFNNVNNDQINQSNHTDHRRNKTLSITREVRIKTNDVGSSNESRSGRSNVEHITGKSNNENGTGSSNSGIFHMNGPTAPNPAAHLWSNTADILRLLEALQVLKGHFQPPTTLLPPVRIVVQVEHEPRPRKLQCRCFSKSDGCPAELKEEPLMNMCDVHVDVPCCEDG